MRLFRSSKAALFLSCFFALFFCEKVMTAIAQEEVSLPPGPRPVPVHVAFYLVNLNSLSEQTETFDADLYLQFNWKDERLKFEGTEEKVYLEKNASDVLQSIWNPQIEFVNTAQPTLTNELLRIAPDGTVSYQIGINATFRADLDLRRFPFDHQKLEVHLQSFMWERKDLIFVPNLSKSGFTKENTFEGLYVTSLGNQVKDVSLEDWNETYSQYTAGIYISRNASFYLWTVFAPLVLIFLISCTIFFVPVENFHDRIGISLTALLACIATQFTINFNLPKISYLTVIDKTFLITYLCIALGVLLCVAQLSVSKRHAQNAERISHAARWVIPIAFVAMISWVVFQALRG